MLKSRSAIRLALVGNPNTGKTSLFNELTGLNQKIGNYPGITVDKKTGFSKLDKDHVAEIIDLPGTYSLNPSSMDEVVVHQSLTEHNHEDFPDGIVVVADASNLKRNLYLFTQVHDLGMPVILVLNMMDLAERRGIEIDVEKLQSTLGVQVVPVSVRKHQGIKELKKALIDLKKPEKTPIYQAPEQAQFLIDFGKKHNLGNSDYAKWLICCQDEQYNYLDQDLKNELYSQIDEQVIDLKKLRIKETIQRYQVINETLKKCEKRDPEGNKTLTARIDKVLTHKIWGLVIFAMVMLLMFQSIFTLAVWPMEWIENGFFQLSQFINNNFTAGPLTSLIADGVISGIAGVFVFIPQIAILFFFLSILEESGYMSRVVFLMDKLLRKYGLSGKSVVPLISGTACAIPAVMSARNIENWKERLLTILVTPLTTCSARLPVYSMLIALIIPEGTFWGFNTQGLVLMGMYLLGFAAALLFAAVLNKFIKSKGKSHFIMEMPSYKVPVAKNVGLTIWDKTKSFVNQAGRIILSISIILWVLASFGPDEGFDNAEEIVKTEQGTKIQSQEEFDAMVASYKLENSYIGRFGKVLEPVFKPLGYDWKIGIAILSSIAAREVFVGTMATIYSVGSEDELTVKEHIAQEINPDTGEPLYNFAVGMSLLMFYAFAMQCMGTIATVKKETNTWRWPLLQFTVLTLFAYISAYVTFNILS